MSIRTAISGALALTWVPWVLLPLALLLGGCGAELGGGAGVTHPGHAMGFGRVAVATKAGTPLNSGGFMAGLALENRAEEKVGSRSTLGLLLGFGENPQMQGSRFGYEVYAEGGTPIRETFFRRGDYYLGLGFGLPIRLSSQRELTDLNRSIWILSGHPEFVPLVRLRTQHDDGAPDGHDRRWEFGLGLALRVRVYNDVF